MSKSKQVLDALEESFVSVSKAYLQFPSASLKCERGEHKVRGFSIVQVKKADGSGFRAVRIEHPEYGSKLRGQIVRAVGSGFALSHARTKTVRGRLDSLIQTAITGAKSVIAEKESSPDLPVEVAMEEERAMERARGRAHKLAIQELERLLSGPLSTTSEEELVRLYRELRIREVMGA